MPPDIIGGIKLPGGGQEGVRTITDQKFLIGELSLLG